MTEGQLSAAAVSMALEDQTAVVDDDTIGRYAAEIIAAGRQWRDRT
jgi:hypothetical protein